MKSKTYLSGLLSLLAVAACGAQDASGPSDSGAPAQAGGASAGGTSGAGGADAGGAGATGGDSGTGGTSQSGAAGDGGAPGSAGQSGDSGIAGGSGGQAVMPTPVACGTMAGGGTATTVSINGNDVASTNVNGLTFKGFGVLSANGTSALLMDYKSEHPQQYAELLKILFGGTRPIMTHVKIEMGNDRNNSTGPEPATMRLSNEAANVKRSPGFQLAADAKKVNPNLKVSILRWNSPGWVGNNDQVYSWYQSSILAAYRAYGYMVDYVNPGLNERAADLTWTKQFADRVKADATGFASPTEQGLFNAIKVVI